MAWKLFQEKRMLENMVCFNKAAQGQRVCSFYMNERTSVENTVTLFRRDLLV
jgi:hypothetical protein